MGTEIQLKVSGVSIDYAKNSMGRNHGILYQEEDKHRRRSDQIDYEYYGEDVGQELAAIEAAFVRKLSRVLPRLDLLGFTLEAARTEYNALLDDEQAYGYAEEGDGPDFLSFEEYCAFVSMFPLSTLDDTYVEYTLAEREKVITGLFEQHRKVISRIPKNGYNDLYWSEKSYFASVVCILDPYSMLQVFAMNPLNAEAEVVWQYGPMVDAGWEALESFIPAVPRNQTVLVVTEGSSDARIIKHALHLVRGDLLDFFRFIDLEGAHPFWGTGNLVKFAEGLLRIDVHNQIIFLLDNDAEGLDAFRRLTKLGLPSNMRAMMLPYMEQFEEFPARGPEGVAICNINGRAAAIECYLDLRMPNHPPAHVQWSNFKKDQGGWHGALEYKESYTKGFLDLSRERLQTSGYDTSKLAVVLDSLIAEAVILISSNR